MKNILIILTLFLFSCNESVIISKEEYNKLKGDTVKPEYPKFFKLYTDGLSFSNREGIVLGSDDHEYLVIHYGSNGENIMHYVDCKKCKRDTL